MGKPGLVLFGADEGWHPEDWTDSDDRVRGGQSQSYLSLSAGSARFHGNLDIKTLGGAGFASQRTTGEGRTWDLSPYEGIELTISKSDGKQYTFILKDELLPPKAENGREQSTISYEYDFAIRVEPKMETSAISIPWDEFKATYRGKEKEDAPAVDLKSIKRMSIMMRSFFGTQQGDFSLTIDSIAARSRTADAPDEGADVNTPELDTSRL